MGGDPVDVSGMNQRITIQHRNVSIGPNGYEDDEWQDYYLCWAYANGLSGSEYWAAQAVQAQKTISFSIRHCKKVDEINTRDYRVIFKGKVFNILDVDNVRYENDLVKLKCIGQSVEVV